MKTKFIAPRVWSLALLFFVPLMFLACNRQNEVKSPDQVLIEKLSKRFEEKDYVSSRSLNNPYDQFGIDVAEFRKEISSDPAFRKLIKSQDSKKPKFVHAGLFQFAAANNEKTWGFQNPEDLQLAKSKIQGFQERKGKKFDPEKIDVINGKLISYSRDASGVNEMIEDAFAEKRISEIQSEILKMTFSQITRAADVDEAYAITSTIEHEVINSEINGADKPLILSISSIMAHDFENQLSHLPNLRRSPIFKKTAQAIVIFVAFAAVGAFLGGVWGLITCCAFDDPATNYNNCTWNCVGDSVHDGALVGATLGLAAI
jgi:hypothetical protein